MFNVRDLLFMKKNVKGEPWHINGAKQQLTLNKTKQNIKQNLEQIYKVLKNERWYIKSVKRTGHL